MIVINRKGPALAVGHSNRFALLANLTSSLEALNPIASRVRVELEDAFHVGHFAAEHRSLRSFERAQPQYVVALVPPGTFQVATCPFVNTLEDAGLTRRQLLVISVLRWCVEIADRFGFPAPATQLDCGFLVVTDRPSHRAASHSRIAVRSGKSIES